MRDPLIDPIAHIREETESLSLTQLAKKYRKCLRRCVTNMVEAGAVMEGIFARLKGHARRDFLRKEFNVSERTAYVHLAAFRNRDKIRESTLCSASEEDSLSPELAEAMRIQDEAESEKEVTSPSDTPYGPSTNGSQQSGNGRKPPEQPAREPGDEKAYEDIAAKILKALCPRCTRLKGPSCQKCRSMAYRVEHGSAESPAKTTGKTKGKENPNNGRLLFDWAEYRRVKTLFLACVDALAKGYGKEFTPERAAFDRLLLQLDTQVKDAYKKWAKQEPPQFS